MLFFCKEKSISIKKKKLFSFKTFFKTSAKEINESCLLNSNAGRDCSLIAL